MEPFLSMVVGYHSFCLFFSPKNRHGIVAWQYYPFVNWGTTLDDGQLLSVIYNKQHSDSYLHVSFHSATTESGPEGCSQWNIKLNGIDCKSPAPICTLDYRHDTTTGKNKEWRISPSVVSGFCRSTAQGTIGSGNVSISVDVGKCSKIYTTFTNEAHTGAPFNVESITSYVLVEEYN